MYPNASLQLNIETKSEVKFFTAPFLPFDNFSAHQVNIWGKKFLTAEHAFQWKKFESTNPQVAEQILNAPSPWAVKKISSSTSNRRPDWHEARVSVMEDVLRAKFNQNEDARNMLMKTGNKQLIENSPYDSFWGCGKDGNGVNMVGQILMKIRSELK